MINDMRKNGSIESPSREEVSHWIAEAYWDLEGSPIIKNSWLKTGYSWFIYLLFSKVNARRRRRTRCRGLSFLFAFFLIATFFTSMTSSSFLASSIDLLIDFNFATFFLVFHTRWVVNKIGKEWGASRMVSTATSHSLFFVITLFQLASALTPLSESPTAVNSINTTHSSASSDGYTTNECHEAKGPPDEISSPARLLRFRRAPPQARQHHHQPPPPPLCHH